MSCKVCDVLKQENEHLRKWIDRLMDEKVLDPDPQVETVIPNLEDPGDTLKETEQFGQ